MRRGGIRDTTPVELVRFDAVSICKQIQCIFGLILLGGLVSCSAPPGGFAADDPGSRIASAKDAARENDASAIPELIEMLDSDDPAARLVAIRTLERLTGQTLGYDHAARPFKRDQAVKQWVHWYESGGEMDPKSGDMTGNLTENSG